MPLYDALLLGCAIIVLVALTWRDRVQPFLALCAVAAAYGVALGMSIGGLSKSFGQGFAQTVAAGGLIVAAAAIVAAVADGSGASARIAAFARRMPAGWWPAAMLACGLVAGLGGAMPAAFAVLMPLRQAAERGLARARATVATLLGLVLAAGGGMLWPSPVVIAAVAILHADLARVLLYGIPLALLSTFPATWLAYRSLVRSDRSATGAQPVATRASASPRSERRVAWALIAVTLLMTLQLVVQSIGTMPSEPLGGGPTREMLLGIGRPFNLLIVGVGLMLLALGRSDSGVLGSNGWVGKALGRAAWLVLLLGAAGGLQSLTQDSGMAELLAERLLDWKVGIALPFVVAAVLKVLQGSSLVAVITAAGMIEPLLPALGLDSEAGRSLAVVALGAGSVTGIHINDPYFWLVSDAAGLRPARALLLVGGGSLLTGAVALAGLAAIAAFGAH